MTHIFLANDIGTTQESVVEEFLSMTEKEMNLEDRINPYNFSSEVISNFNSLSRDAHGYLRLVDCITALVENEFPIHYELICKKVAPLMGNEKATVKVRREVDYALKSLSTLKQKDNFLYPQSYDKITPRAVGNTRSIDYISPDELMEAMLVIAASCVGITREALYAEAARAYGFNRNGGKIQTAMQMAYNQILDSGRGNEVDGKLIV